jgi:hypothetical protein
MKGTKTLGALNDAHTLDLLGNRDILMTLTGAMVATIVLETTRDGGATWETLPILLGDGTFVQSVSAAGVYRSQVICPTGLMKFRARVSAYTSGAPVCVIEVFPV